MYDQHSWWIEHKINSKLVVSRHLQKMSKLCEINDIMNKFSTCAFSISLKVFLGTSD